MGSAPTEGAGLRPCLDELVERLVEVCGECTDAAAHGRPGRYVLPAEVERSAARRQVERFPPLTPDSRSAELGLAFGLSSLELDLLLLAAAPDLDERVELLCGYAHDDLTRRRPSAGLAARLLGLALDDAALHRALGADGALVRGELLAIAEAAIPFPGRLLQCTERVVHWLVGMDEPEGPLARLIVTAPPTDSEEAQRVGAALGALTLCYLRSPPGSDPRGLAVAAAGVLDAGTTIVDLDHIEPADHLDEIIGASLLEARLRRTVLVAGPIERVHDAGSTIRPWVEADWPVILHGSRSWDPRWSRRAPLVLNTPFVQSATQLPIWREVLADVELSEGELARATAPFRLTGEQVALAAGAAASEAAAEGRAVTVEDIHRSARARNTGILEQLAKRVQPRATWDDLVLPPATFEKLHELVDRTRHRELVYGSWGMTASGARGDGLSVLFAGASGTGKTLAAEVVAQALGLDLYIVDLSRVVDKYIGETEKNLERIFDEAEGVNGVLLFDEADALFGKRSEVKDAHDRYANLETAHLLQRIESFRGTAILTTNLRTNLDDAFARRLGSIITFPVPDREGRLELWRRFLGGKVPVSDDVNLEFCAENFTLTGANIRNIALAAAFLAAEAGPPIEMDDIVKALEREYEKLGRLRSPSEFGPYAALLSDSGEGADT